MRKTYVLSATLVVMIAVAIPTVALGGGARAASTHTVILRHIRFHPSTLNIDRGDSVKWLWEDGEEHNVTFHSLHSRTMTHGSYTVRFMRSGTFNYNCTIHASEGMRGKIVVH